MNVEEIMMLFLHIYLILLLFIVDFYVAKKEVYFIGRREILFININIFSILILEYLIHITSLYSFDYKYTLTNFLVFAYLVNEAFPLLFWFIYILKRTGNSRHGHKIIYSSIMTAPLIATLVMVILNIFFPFLYTVDYETGTYARLNYMFFLFIPFLISFTAAIFVTLKYRKELSKYEFIGNIVSIAIAIVGVVLQYFDNGGYYIWPAIAISSIYLFLFSSVDSIFKDGLTGTNNRLKLIHYVHGAISKSYGNRKPMLAMMIDIDHFKNINDQYGHKEGDYALKVAADILKSVCTKNIFLSRYGGDEFIVLLFDKKHIENSDLKEEIVQKANEFNEKKIKPYTINFSIGEVLFNGDNPLYDYRMLLDTIDKKMYEEKRNPFR